VSPGATNQDPSTPPDTASTGIVQITVREQQASRWSPLVWAISSAPTHGR
jgi:hypothetical protein